MKYKVKGYLTDGFYVQKTIDEDDSFNAVSEFTLDIVETFKIRVSAVEVVEEKME